MKRALIALLAVAACGKEPVAPAPPARKSVAQEIVAKLEVEAPEVPLLAADSGDGDLAEHVEGLLATLGGSDDTMRRIARDELASLGPRAVARVAAALARSELPAPVRIGAAQFLGQQDTVEASRTLLERVELARKQIDPDVWMRAQCAWRLGETKQDWVVPRLLLCLRYEADYETVTYLAGTLAHFGNYAGLEALRVIASSNANDQVRARAAAMSGQLAAQPNFGELGELERAWLAGDPDKRLPQAAWSPRHQLELARMIAGFSEWQLRGVDDARFVIAREQPRCAELLGAVLVDENRYVRTHAAQCLERMGRRAKAAGPALLAALEDPELTVPATLALGGIGYEPAESALVAQLDARKPLEQRLAAARALGHLGLATPAHKLRSLLDAKEPLELRVLAACALAALTPLELDRPTTELLIASLTSGLVESLGPENALDLWLVALAEKNAHAKETLDAWLAIKNDDPRQRVAQRAGLLKERLPALIP